MRAGHARDPPQPDVHVVAGKYGKVRGLVDALGAHGPHPGVRFQNLREVADELAHPPDPGGRLDHPEAAVLEGDDGPRQVRSQAFRATICTDGRPAAALWSAERLVQHEHACVETQLGGADLAHYAIEIGVVVKAQPARRGARRRPRR